MSQGNKMQYAQMIWDYMKREDPLEKVSNKSSLQSRIQDFPEVGTNIRFCQIFPKNCMILEEFGCRVGARPSLPTPHPKFRQW